MAQADRKAVLSYFLKRDKELGNAILKLEDLAAAEGNPTEHARIKAQVRSLEDQRSELDAEREAMLALSSTMALPTVEVLETLNDVTRELGKKITDAKIADAIVSATAQAITDWVQKK